ncbi:hypothetical protein EVJ58_g3733 [Rhodofomes roseus]|uniref:Glutamate--cysteine ligase n=1 Tax=Rhodofomes roseus TaxID=34475 RepID=A0A4Y9YL21_9APHY|nr:hypothetical protein EVJ58_g3733 [Rhodofomes roseus]
MGLLSLGTPLAWDDAKRYADHVRTHGITQFLSIWDRLKDRCGDELLWGDEIEYLVVSFDNEGKNARLSLRQTEILAKLAAITSDIASARGESLSASVPTFHPEYGRFMLESTPGSPYSGSLSDILSVEDDMRWRRQLARRYLKQDEIPYTLTSFPRLGVPGVFTDPYFDPADAKSSHSLFLPEEITNPHARFPSDADGKYSAATRLKGRNKPPALYRLAYAAPIRGPDHSMAAEHIRGGSWYEAKRGAALNDHIYMDAMGFGMGCCCLQITFQSCNVNEARRLYDALVPVAPLMLALTAASPLFRGYIADVDCRWDVISACVDDRTEEERGVKPLKENRFRIPKSRYSSVSLYLSDHWMHRPEYNDIDAPYDQAIFERLQKHGIDSILARHISHLFIRDPIVIFSETIDQDDENSNDHFENIQSTNWQTVRFKPPPVNSPIGWRVEFRSMEVQMTDFENAAFSIFVVLLSRAILAFNLNLYLPISKVDENMARAQKRDALHTQKFYFRKDVFPPGGPSRPESRKEKKLRNCWPSVPRPANGVHAKPVEDEYEEMSLQEIMFGKADAFPGLFGLVYAYLDTLDMEEEERVKLERYLDLIKRRTDGTLKTAATWIREFVRTHPAYKFDSAVSQEINYDLLVAVDEIERGVRHTPDFLPQGAKR